jgi:hypothetical protein
MKLQTVRPTTQLDGPFRFRIAAPQEPKAAVFALEFMERELRSELPEGSPDL